MRRFLLMLLCLLLLPVPGVAQTDGPCAGFVPRLELDERGRVTPGDANNVRAEPSASADLVGQLAGGAAFTVLDGPVCTDDLTWWRVAAVDSDVIGWTVAGTTDDYWLEPGGWLGYTPDQVGLDYYPVANAATVEVIPPDRDSYDFFYGAPDMLQVTLDDLIISEFVQPRVLVIPIAYFETDDEGLYNALVRYHGSLYSDAPTEDDIVIMPQPNAALVHASHVAYIETDDTRGYRMLVMFAQYPAPIRGHELHYLYVGLTEDGSHALAVVLPVTSMEQNRYLEERNDEDGFYTPNGVAQEYINILSDYAAALPPDDFYPNLDTLDEVLRSVQLGDDAALPANREARPAEQMILPEIPGGEVLSYAGEDLGFASSYFEISRDDQPLYMMIQVNTERRAHRDLQSYPGWRGFIDGLNAEIPVTEFEVDPFGVSIEDAPLGAVRRVETAHMRGVRFVTGSGSGAMVGPPLTYNFWGVTAENSVFTVRSVLDVGAVPETAGPTEILAAVDAARLEAALAERDEIVLGLTFEVR